MGATAKVLALPVATKRCPACAETKAAADFYPDASQKSGLASRCKKCDYAKRTARRAREPEERRAYWSSEWPKQRRKAFTPEQRTADSVSTFWRGIRRRYGMTEPEVRALLARQSGLCGNRACGKELSLDVNGREHRGQNPGIQRAFIDHCHKTGKVRGLLCDHCNKAEGFYEKNKNLLLGIFEYLQRSTA